MGYQLWTSAVTGYRRIGTSLSEVRALFETGITAKAIFEPLKCCPAECDALQMHQVLTERGFDVAGVKDFENSEALGFVHRADLLNGIVRNHIRPFGRELLIGDSTPLAELLFLFRNQNQIFVTTGGRVSGIITRADLQKPPLRIYLFGLISLFEMHMAYWVFDEYGEENWKMYISDQRLESVHKNFQERKQINQETGLLDYLQFADKKVLILKSQRLRDLLGIKSCNSGKRYLDQAESLRNMLAHSQKDLTAGEADWNKIINTVEFIERALKLSDAIIERSAADKAEGFEESLWCTG